MNKLEVLTIDRNEKWDLIVKSFSDYDVYYLSGYCKGFMVHGDGEPLLFYYNDDKMRAINVVFKRDISKDKNFKFLKENTYFDFSTPYGYGGWLIEGDKSIDNLNKEYTKWCTKNNIISEIVRFHPILSNSSALDGMYDIVNIGNTVSIVCDENIWENITSKNRNVIRKAQKNGIIINHNLDSNTLNVFISLYNATMKKDNADNYYYFDNEFYNVIKADMNEYADIFYAIYEGKIISSAIILKCNKKLSYHLSGSDIKYKSLAATNLLLYEVSKWGYENGYKTFHLGGGVGSKEDSLYSFKKSFNKNNDCVYSIGKKIFDIDKYNELVFKRKGDMRDNYFPLYRA